MKIKTISRSERQYTRDRGSDILKIHRNLDPALHPFEKAREYTRALNAVKLDKVFAKPFVGALDGHGDSVYSMATSPRSLVTLISGACDGEVIVWDLAHRKRVFSTFAHTGFVRGVTVAPDGRSFFSCSDDKTVKQWSLELEKSLKDLLREEQQGDSRNAVAETEDEAEPLNMWTSTSPFSSIDHHWKDSLFVTSGHEVNVWDHHRAEPVHTYSWGADSIVSVKFNPAEACLFASTATDRNICLYDVRMGKAMRKVVLQMRSNAIAWNPMEPFNFTAANEDHNLYTFDMRNLERASVVHKDHVSAVMDVAYSPTGKEFATSSYDRTIRMFRYNEGRSREVYHTKRMQRAFCVKYSADNKFVLSGSDDTNIRIWKAKASERLGSMVPRQREHKEYMESIKKRYQHMPEIRRIAKHRHLPKSIKKAAQTKSEAQEKEKRKENNRRKHSKPGSVPYKAARKQPVIKQLE